MPSYLHETLVEMFRDRPELAAEVLAGPLCVPVPPYREARLSPTDLTELVPTEYRADLVVTFTNGNSVVLAVVIEAQLRADPRKRRVWPAYVAVLHARLGCPVLLLVLCPTRAVAQWCARPIVVSDPGLVLTPVALGPDAVPVVTDPAEAGRRPQLAVLSALLHSAEADRADILEALLVALRDIDHAHAKLYAGIVLAALPPATRKHLEALMDLDEILANELPPGFMKRVAEREARELADARAEGVAAGEGRALLTILEARELAVSPETRERITGCTDPDQVQIWLRRALTASRVEDLFD
jgi:hypothetical protein